MVRRVYVTCEVKDFRSIAEAKASLKWANKYVVYDPKPGDLAMVRLKWR